MDSLGIKRRQPFENPLQNRGSTAWHKANERERNMNTFGRAAGNGNPSSKAAKNNGK